MVTETEVRAALDRAIHPAFGLSLIALNMVRVVPVSADRIEVNLVRHGACPGCPAGEVALAQARQNLAALHGGSVKLNLLPQVWKPPWEQLVNVLSQSQQGFRHTLALPARASVGIHHLGAMRIVPQPHG